MSIVIKVEHVSKMYRLGEVGTGTLTHDLNQWWARLRGKEDPSSKIADLNDRTKVSDSQYVWALKDVSFDVNQGEVLGIIGRNGAGKSTLLKILSRTTLPTEGIIRAKGRIASLLEVGTGFHPELTGRENIFQNGAILGMTRHEIRRKFDEIVDFAGVAKYIDTPVKRYSSGMYVRLAFAVAAHLEPEILIVDEVLAVGDAEFQKKCLGKMKDVSTNDGRTVLFVSHNLAAVKTLCSRSVLMSQGTVRDIGDTNQIVTQYVKLNSDYMTRRIEYKGEDQAPGNDKIKVLRAEVTPDVISVDDPVTISFELLNMMHFTRFKVSFDLVNSSEQIVFSTAVDITISARGSASAKCYIPGHFLNDDIYSVWFYMFTDEMTPLLLLKDMLNFEIIDKSRDYAYLGKINGVVRPILRWETSG
ncbi:MAG: ATP-binding cassette domain-containing protein [Bacteroidetes bacterium]|nr:ATP-binding cassette domain-containing protein [Bacteroidota bacterium]